MLPCRACREPKPPGDFEVTPEGWVVEICRDCQAEIDAQKAA